MGASRPGCFEQLPALAGDSSPSSVRSTNVEDEVAFALEEHKTVIPVFYRDCKVPFQLRPFQYLDFRTDYDRGLRTLLKTLGVEQPAVAGGGAAVSAVPKNTAADVPAAAEQARLQEGRRLAAEKAQREERERQRKAAEDKARLFLSKKKMMMIGLGGGAIVLLLLWMLWPRGSNNQASQPQTAQQTQTTVPQSTGQQTLTTVPQRQSMEQQPQRTEPRPAAAGAKKPGAQKKCPEAVYCDPGTNLMWTMEDNGKDITWQGADQYCRSLSLAGLSGWELPPIDELEKLYDPQSSSEYKIRGPFRLTACCPWSSTKEGSGSAWGFLFSFGERFRVPLGVSSYYRALCVRRSGE